jgi:hypothetical protein
VRTFDLVRIFAWHRYQRRACTQGKAHAKIRTATFNARGIKATSKLLAGANYVLIASSWKRIVRVPKVKEKSIGKWKKIFVCL